MLYTYLVIVYIFQLEWISDKIIILRAFFVHHIIAKNIQVTTLANSLWYLFCMKRDWPILTPFFHYSVKHNKRWQQHKDFLFRQLGIITVLSTVCNPFFYLWPFENTIIQQDTVLWCFTTSIKIKIEPQNNMIS